LSLVGLLPIKINRIESLDPEKVSDIPYCPTSPTVTLPPSARDLIRDLIDFAEDRDTDAILARRELREKDVLLNTRKTRKKGKRVALKGKYLLTKEDILKVVRDLERETKKKETKKGVKKTKYILISSEEEEEESVDELA
jgi:hypothetical protein